jgi:acetylornithine deacetylase/succinyl-diaminopimelate desuccinylase-like protein
MGRKQRRLHAVVSGAALLCAAGCAGSHAATGGASQAPVAAASVHDSPRDLLKELIEINSVHANGSTVAARAVEARLLAAGFAASDVQVLAPPDHPTKGNVVVRLHGRGKGRAVLFVGHLDVVEARREDWTYDPFLLTEKDGWLYGRGTSDMKGADVAMLAGIVRMKREGLVPDRDLLVAFTADEEAGGDANGVEWLLAAHRELVDASLVVNPDVGGAAMKGGRKIFLGVQTSEKVAFSFQVEITDKGGHSSRPTPSNPIHRLAKDLARLADFRFPFHLTETARLYFARRALLESGAMRADMQAVAATPPDPAAVERLSALTETNVFFRTTCVATRIEGGHAENALPQRARATIQCRAIPGETLEEVQRALVAAMGDPTLVFTTLSPAHPSPESSPTPQILGAVEKVARGMWPDVAVLPLMGCGASDGVYTRAAGIPTYGIDAMFDDIDDNRAHGKDERIGVTALAEDVEFTYRLMKALTVDAGE